MRFIFTKQDYLRQKTNKIVITTFHSCCSFLSGRKSEYLMKLPYKIVIDSFCCQKINSAVN